MNTVSQLERHLTGDHIGSILECADVSTANQRILDCLVEQLEKKEDLFDLCSWLGLITDAPLLTITIEDLKIGKKFSNYPYFCCKINFACKNHSKISYMKILQKIKTL